MFGRILLYVVCCGGYVEVVDVFFRVGVNLIVVIIEFYMMFVYFVVLSGKEEIFWLFNKYIGRLDIFLEFVRLFFFYIVILNGFLGCVRFFCEIGV